MHVDEVTKLDKEEKKRKHRDEVIMVPLIMGCKDFSNLPETRCLENFDDALDKRIRMCTNLNYFPKVKDLIELSRKNQIVLHSTMKSLHQRCHFCLNIDIISKYEAFSNSHFSNCVRLCQGYFDGGLCLHMSSFVVRILKYI